MAELYTAGTAFTTPTCVNAWVEYPFRDEGDSTTKLYHHTMRVKLTSYAPLADDDVLTAAGEKPTRSPFSDDSAAYYVGDSVPSPIDGGLVEFDRMFANIPATRTDPSGFYATTFPTMFDGDFADNMSIVTSSTTLTKNDTTLKVELSFDRLLGRAYIYGAGTAAVNTTTWTATTIGNNGKIAYDANGGATLDGSTYIKWIPGGGTPRWQISTAGTTRYDSEEDVAHPSQVQVWNVAAGGTAPAPIRVFEQIDTYKAGRTIVYDSISYGMRGGDTEQSERARFKLTGITDAGTNGEVTYTAENSTLYNLDITGFTETQADIVMALNRDSPATLNVPSFRKYEYYKSSDPTGIELLQADLLQPWAYGLGNYEEGEAYGTTTTPDNTTYKALAARGDLILAEDQTLERWMGNIYKVESILVEPR